MFAAGIDRTIDGVVIGASAGGVEALSVLLPALPATLDAAVFVVIHVPRERPSFLAEIFRDKCMRPVREAEDNESVEDGTVYFAPPDYHMLVDAGPRLALSVDGLVRYSRPSIDVLFESAADLYRERLLGIILTGGNDDGASGLQAIHRAGGITIVQEPRGAKVPGMPSFAIERIEPSFVFTLEQIAIFLNNLKSSDASRHFAVTKRA